MLPHDHPTAERPHRVYAALTNHCNRACPWCSTCSSPSGQTFLDRAALRRAIPTGPYELQLEGGEPTVHPEFWQFVDDARADPALTHLVLCTNGVMLPRQAKRLHAWLGRLGAPLTVKLSVNHHLLDEDPGLLALAATCRDALTSLGGDRRLILNVRLRRGHHDHGEDDHQVAAAVEAAGLSPLANVFYLQRYGFASDETTWDEPFLAGTRFSMVNPDGAVFAPAPRGLVARSEAMRRLPQLAQIAQIAQIDRQLRRLKSTGFELATNSTARRTVTVPIAGRPVEIYANANLSVYSAQVCNARCPFCVEELRPASRGTELAPQRTVESDDDRYFAALDETLAALRPLDPSVSVTGGEPSKDPRLPRILRTLAAHQARKRTVTTNGSGLLDEREGRAVIDWITTTGVRHLNLSRAHPDHHRNAALMQLDEGLADDQLIEVVRRASAAQTRVRLSCVLLEQGMSTVDDLIAYIDFAASVGVDNVIFRQLMKTDPSTVAANRVVKYSDRQRIQLGPLLDQLSHDPRFVFQRQIVGYYYYVEVYRYRQTDVVFEEADLAHLEAEKRRAPSLVHELIFHPNARLASTWQPWDGVLL